MNSVSVKEDDNDVESAAQPTPSRLKPILFAVAKYGISFSILAFLFYRAGEDNSFAVLRDSEKKWNLLLGGLVTAFLAVLLTFARWHLLVVALNLPLSIRQAFRLGFIGYFFNFLSLGVVGGDALRAYFASKELPDHRPEAVATVVLDRIVGLYALILSAVLAYRFALWTQQPGIESLATLATTAAILTVIGTIGLAVILIPAIYRSSLWLAVTKIPKIGPIANKIGNALALYREKLGILLVAIIMSLVTHMMFAGAVYMLAASFDTPHPSLLAHLIIVPFANLSGALPLPGGMGGFEFALDLLYRGVAGDGAPQRHGFVIALVFRIITLIIAAVGMVIYFVSKKEITAAMKQLESNSSISS